MENTKKFAVLIDADNSSVQSISSVLEEVAKYGIASVKRVYGDRSSESLKNWREVLLPHAITPVQQFAYTHGKRAKLSGLIKTLHLFETKIETSQMFLKKIKKQSV